MGAVITRYGTAKPIVASSVAFALGYALFLRVGRDAVRADVPADDAAGRPRLRARLRGAERPGAAGVSDHEQGLAAGLVQTSFQMGGAIVLAAVSAVVGRAARSATTGPRSRSCSASPCVSLFARALAGVVPTRAPRRCGG